jgi:hypothetical protein
MLPSVGIVGADNQEGRNRSDRKGRPPWDRSAHEKTLKQEIYEFRSDDAAPTMTIRVRTQKLPNRILTSDQQWKFICRRNACRSSG